MQTFFVYKGPGMQGEIDLISLRDEVQILLKSIVKLFIISLQLLTKNII